MRFRSPGDRFANRGMLDAARNDGEVAGVIAHESVTSFYGTPPRRRRRDRSFNSSVCWTGSRIDVRRSDSSDHPRDHRSESGPMS